MQKKIEKKRGYWVMKMIQVLTYANVPKCVIHCSESVALSQTLEGGYSLISGKHSLLQHLKTNFRN